MDIKYYLGRFSEESHLFDDVKYGFIPSNGDFVNYENEVYKIMYTMVDWDHETLLVFVRVAIEEDF